MKESTNQELISLRQENKRLNDRIIELENQLNIYHNRDWFSKIDSDKLSDDLVRYQMIAEGNIAEMYIVDSEYRFIYVNSLVTKNLGYSKDELIGKRPDYVNPNMSEDKIYEIFNNLEQEIGKKIIIESVHKRKDGTTYPVELQLSSFSLNSEINFAAIVTDISRRKKQDLEIKKHLSSLEMIANSALDFLRIAYEKEFYEYFSKELNKIVPNSYIIVNSFNKELNLATTEAIEGKNKTIKFFFHFLGRSILGMQFPIYEEDILDLASKKVKLANKSLYELSSGKIPQFVITPIERMTGIKYVYGIGFTLKNELLGNSLLLTKEKISKEDKKLIETLTNLASITLSRLLTENQKSEHEEKYKDLFEKAPVGIVHFDKTTTITDCNNKFEEIFGLSKDRITGYNIRDNTKNKLVLDKISECFQNGESFFEEKITTKLVEGTEFIVKVYIKAIKDSNNNLISGFAIVEDISTRKRIEEKIKESEELYKGLFENNSSTILIINPDDGTIIKANETACKYYGYSLEEMMSMNINDINILSPTQLKVEMQNAVNEKRNYFIFKHKLKSGEIRDVEVYSGKVNISGEYYLYSIIHDITEKQNFSLRLSRGEKMAKIGFWEFDLRKGLLTGTEGAKEIFGMHDNEVTEEAVRLAALPEYRELLETSLRELITEGKPYNIEYQIVNRETGRIRYVNSLAEYDMINELISGSIQDITERKEFERKLQQSNIKQEMLNIELREKNEELIAAKEKAEESDELKSKFLANMSHEIRTPMNAINGFSELLQDKDISKEEINEYSMIINFKSKQLLRLINDILDISKIEANSIEMNYTEFYLRPLLDNLISEYRFKTFNEGLEFVEITKSIDEDLKLYTDRSRLEQVFNNILSNAIKFTKEGSVEFAALKHENYIEFYVKDTGIGISENDKSKIFERFTQLESELTFKNDGTGLGLSITKALLQKLNSNIEVESELGKGSKFSFKIDRSLQPKETIKIPVRLDYKSKFLDNKNILVVEDDIANYYLLEKVLIAYGANILRAEKGNEAWNIIQNNNEIDLILLDIRLPEIDGMKLIKMIKGKYPDMPVIAQTAFAMIGDMKDILSAGFDDYLAKPIKKEKLLEKVKKQFDKS